MFHVEFKNKLNVCYLVFSDLLNFHYVITANTYAIAVHIDSNLKLWMLETILKLYQKHSEKLSLLGTILFLNFVFLFLSLLLILWLIIVIKS